ncbi:AI-2E family transporter [bacterium]|nr:AI-2E family transporter [bacterium]MBU1073254.1 AI-2E family transporter [bacterium]MBU1676501.1 AI-2E family transporter [bacterium]
MERERFQKGFLLLVVAAISLLFVSMLRPFLMAILLAGIFAGLAHPLYRRLLRRLRGRKTLTSLLTMLVLVLAVLAPLLAVLGIVAGQALLVSEAALPWVERQLEQPDRLAELMESLPFQEHLAPYREQLLTKAGQVVGSAGVFLFESLSAATRGTVSFLFQVFILVYTMFFFLKDGEALLDRILYYLPLRDDDERRMLDRFTSVTRATLKGTLLIGIAQGALAGAAFAVAGIDGAVFWGTVMVLLSVIPGIGTGLVWLPAAVILVASDRVGAGIGLALFCALVVGSVDNLLRPRLVGRDTRLHDLLILFSTLGGIFLFGVLGFIIGPIVAALFVTVWDIFGVAFRDALPSVRPFGGK